MVVELTANRDNYNAGTVQVHCGTLSKRYSSPQNEAFEAQISEKQFNRKIVPIEDLFFTLIGIFF